MVGTKPTRKSRTTSAAPVLNSFVTGAEHHRIAGVGQALGPGDRLRAHPVGAFLRLPSAQRAAHLAALADQEVHPTQGRERRGADGDQPDPGGCGKTPRGKDDREAESHDQPECADQEQDAAPEPGPHDPRQMIGVQRAEVPLALDEEPGVVAGVARDLEDRERSVSHVRGFGGRAHEPEAETEADHHDHRAEGCDAEPELPVLLEGPQTIEGLLDRQRPQERQHQHQAPDPADQDGAPQAPLESFEPRRWPRERGGRRHRGVPWGISVAHHLFPDVFLRRIA